MATVTKNGITYNEEALLKRFSQDYEFAKADRDRNTDGWRKARDQFDGEWHDLTKLQDDENKDQWFFVPKTLMAIHRIECELTMQFFGPGQLKLAKVSPGNREQSTGVAADILDQALHAKVDLELRPFRQYFDAWHRGLVEGTGVLKGGWETGMTAGEDGNVSTINRPGLQAIAGEHACWDPSATTPEDIRYFCHEIWLTTEELWDRFAGGKFDNVDDVLAEASNKDDTALDEWRVDIGGTGDRSRYMHKVVEIWGRFQLKSDEEVDKAHARGEHPQPVDVVGWFYGDKTILRLEKNQYADLAVNPKPFEKLPFWLCTPLPKTNSTRGYSLVLWLRPIQRETNLTRNQRRQAVDLEMSFKVFYDENRLTNLKALDAARYGGRVPTNGPPGQVVEAWHPQTSTGNMVQEEAMLDREFQQVSGVSATDLNAPSPSDMRTATGATIAANRGGVSKETIIQNINLSSMIPSLEFFAAATIVYVSPEEIQSIIQSFEPPPALKDVLKAQYHIELEAGMTAASKDAELQKVMAAINANAQAANAAPEAAIPTLIMLEERMMHLLGLTDLSGYWKMIAEGKGQEEEPAGQGMTAMPNQQNQDAVAAQGRTVTPNETRRA